MRVRGGKFLLRPVGVGVFMICQNGDAFFFEPQEETGGVAFAVENESEAVQERIGTEPGGGGLAGNLP